MKIVMCVKAVVSKLVYSNQQREEKFTMNPYDLYALEKLIEMKNTMDLKITCLCMGSSEAKQVLIRSLAMGADDAVLLSDRRFAGADTYATTYTLYQAMKQIDYDIIVCGGQAVDGETGQVSYGLAERLGLPCVANVLDIDQINGRSMTIQVKGINHIKVMTVKLPIVIAFKDFQMNSGKISLMTLKRAQKKSIPVWNAEDIEVDSIMCGQAGSKTQVLNASSVLDKKNTHFLDGTIDTGVQFLLEKIKLYSQR